MIDPHDEQRWNKIHSKTHSATIGPNKYAVDVEKKFPRKANIAEMGGGTGHDALHFLKQGHRVYLFDISEFALKKASEMATKANSSKMLTTRQLDFGYQSLPMKENSIDVVYSRISLNYFPKDQTVEIFRDINRVLKPGGQAFLSFKSPDDEKEMKRLKKIASLFEDQVFIDHGQLRSRFTNDKLVQILNEAGISGAIVKPHHEDVGVSEKGETLVLYTNEVYFKKPI